LGSSKASIRRALKSIAYEGLAVPVDRERRAEVLEVRPTDRMKEFAGREDQGLLITVRMPEQSVNRVDLLFQEDEFPGTVSVYLDSDKQGDAFAWRASFEVREDGAAIFHPSLNGGELEDYLARRLHECGLLVLRKEGRVIVGAPLFCDGKRDDKERLRTFLRETLTFILVKAEAERRLVYPPGTEPPPLELPASAAAAKSRSRPKKKKPAPPAGAAARPLLAGAPGPARATGKAGSSAPVAKAAGFALAAKGTAAPAPTPPQKPAPAAAARAAEPPKGKETVQPKAPAKAPSKDRRRVAAARRRPAKTSRARVRPRRGKLPRTPRARAPRRRKAAPRRGRRR
jgi:hypothetical protein